jgi:hypothetical protein
MTLGQYVAPLPAKPYDALKLEKETIPELDKIFHRIAAAKDVMRLTSVRDANASIDSGLCILVANDMVLFFKLDKDKPCFFWTRPGAFCLRDPLPGQYWTFSSHGALWSQSKDEVQRGFLWQTYWQRYPQPAITKGKKRSDTDEDGAGSGCGMKHNVPAQTPITHLTDQELAALGL